MKFLSIITPTYNRQRELEVCYNSLIIQSCKDFEWIIVDDGSSDDTESLVKSWIEKNKISIRYFKQQNLGRYMALNKGVEKASAFLSMYMDSDDWFVENSIEEIKKYWTSLDLNLRDGICGLSALCYDDHGNLIGDKYPNDGYISDFFSIRVYDDIKGDKKEIIKTSILKQHTFPYFEGQKRVPTTYVLYGIAKKHKSIFINKAIIYKQYMNTGWSKNIDRVRMKNAITSKEYYKYIINLFYPFRYKKSLVFFANYFRYVFHTKESLIKALKQVKFSILHPLSILIGYIYFKKDQIKNRDIS